VIIRYNILPVTLFTNYGELTRWIDQSFEPVPTFVGKSEIGTYIIII